MVLTNAALHHGENGAGQIASDQSGAILALAAIPLMV